MALSNRPAGSCKINQLIYPCICRVHYINATCPFLPSTLPATTQSCSSFASPAGHHARVLVPALLSAVALGMTSSSKCRWLTSRRACTTICWLKLPFPAHPPPPCLSIQLHTECNTLPPNLCWCHIPVPPSFPQACHSLLLLTDSTFLWPSTPWINEVQWPGRPPQLLSPGTPVSPTCQWIASPRQCCPPDVVSLLLLAATVFTPRIKLITTGRHHPPVLLAGWTPSTFRQVVNSHVI